MRRQMWGCILLMVAGTAMSSSAWGQTYYYRSGSRSSGGGGGTTWYSVGTGYSSHPQNGLPWQRSSVIAPGRVSSYTSRQFPTRTTESLVRSTKSTYNSTRVASRWDTPDMYRGYRDAAPGYVPRTGGPLVLPAGDQQSVTTATQHRTTAPASAGRPMRTLATPRRAGSFGGTRLTTPASAPLR